MKKLSSNSSGQALLLVLLSMSVVLVIVLSILARSTVDIGISSRSEESVRAFSAAEAGIEQALVAGSYSGFIGDAQFNATVSAFSSGTTGFVFPSSLYSGESATVWFVSHDQNGNLICGGAEDYPCFTGNQIQVCWGKEGTSDTPAVEVSVVYLSTIGSYPTAKIARETIDPNASRRGSNSFSEPDGGVCQIDGQNFAFNKIIDLTSSTASGLQIPDNVLSFENGLQLARIAFLYNTDIGHPVGINVDLASSGNSILPAQGLIIDSSGVSGNSTRRVEVIRGFAELPGIFENAVFSQGGIIK